MSKGNKAAWYKRINPHWVGWFISGVAVPLLIWALSNRQGPAPTPPPPPDEPVIVQGAHGWIPPAPEETAAALAAIERQQGMPAQFSRIAQAAIDAEDTKPVFLWDAERKVLGRVLSSWDQGPAGTCVGNGWGRGSQDLILGQIASGSPEQWPGREVAVEPIYAGSRVEVGGGRIRGDGSVGAWAGQWVQKWGILFRQQYGHYDLSSYSTSLCRSWGRSGVPAELEAEAKHHPIKTVAMVTRADELWAALGNGYPVPVCSDVGFEGRPPADGVMEPRGSWAHCMLFRGRFEHPTKGRCYVVQNSWGNYLGRRLTVEVKGAGPVELPEGCFVVRETVAVRMIAQRDSFAISGFVGFPRRTIDWPTQVRPKRRPERWAEPLWAMAP